MKKILRYYKISKIVLTFDIREDEKKCRTINLLSKPTNGFMIKLWAYFRMNTLNIRYDCRLVTQSTNTYKLGLFIYMYGVSILFMYRLKLSKNNFRIPTRTHKTIKRHSHGTKY